ncbi:MAG: YciI family protein [Devosia sp.]|nr:YciI family protein [Devosia sp.]
MRFMIIRKADAETEAEAMPSSELIEAMTAYNEKLVAAGVMVGGDGLKSSRYGAKVSFSNGKPTIVDGPFAEAKELIAGYTVIDVASYEEAIEWVKQWPPEDGNGNVQLELRRFVSMEDFGDAFTPELQAREQVMRDKTGDAV